MLKTTSSMSIVLTLLILTSFASGPATAQIGQPRYGGTLTYAQTGLTHLTPATTTSLMMFAGTLIYNALIHVDMNFKAQPELAESWTISADFKTYTFYLVKNATWHDGVRFTSADVKFSIENVLLPLNPLGKPVYGRIQSIDCPNDFTVVLNMKESVPDDFLFHLTKFSGVIMPKHIWEGTDILKNPYNFKAVGTGPFKLKEFTAENSAILVRNPNYFKKGFPYLDSVMVKVIKAIPSQVVALESGDIDLLPALLPTIDVDRLKEKGFEVFSKPGLAGSIHVIAFNMKREPFGNIKVRQAIAHAIDTKYITDVIGAGMFKRATSGHSSALPFHNPNIKPYDLNLELANKLLDETGYPRKSDGVRFSASIVAHPIFYELPKIAEIVIEQVKKIGIDLKMVKLDTAAYMQAVEGKYDFDMVSYPVSTGAVYSDNAGRYLHSRQIGVQSGNIYSYSSPRMDNAIDSLSKETVSSKRKDLTYEIQQIIFDELPWIPIQERGFIDAWKPEFKGFQSGIDLTPRDGIERVWWTKAPLPVATTVTTKTTDSAAVGLNASTLYATGIIVAIALVSVVLYVRSKKHGKP